MAYPKVASLVRVTLPGRKQPRVYRVVKVGRSDVTLRLAWREPNVEGIVEGKAKTFPRSVLADALDASDFGTES